MKKSNFVVRPEDCKFHVNPEKRKVVCIIENTETMFLDFLEPMERLFFIHCQHVAKYYLPNRFIGVATCSKDDEWNEQTGRLIAYSRAKDKLDKCFFKRANTLINDGDRALEEATSIFNNLGEKLSKNMFNRHNKIKELVEATK